MSKNNQMLSGALSEMKKVLDDIPRKYHFKMQTGNDFRLPALWTFSNRINDCFHLAFVRSGCGYYMLGKYREPFEPGKILLVGNGVIHSRIFDSRNPPSMALMRFWLCRNVDGKPVAEIRSFAFGMVPRNTMKYSELIRNLIETFRQRQNEYDEKKCGAILLQIFCELYRDGYSSLAGESLDIRIQKTLDFIATRGSSGITVGEMATAAGVSTNHLRTLFRRDMGMNPKRYLVERRIHQARGLLTESDCTVRKVAELLDYPDQYTFSKQFKEVMGYSPSKSKKL